MFLARGFTQVYDLVKILGKIIVFSHKTFYKILSSSAKQLFSLIQWPHYKDKIPNHILTDKPPKHILTDKNPKHVLTDKNPKHILTDKNPNHILPDKNPKHILKDKNPKHILTDKTQNIGS